MFIDYVDQLSADSILCDELFDELFQLESEVDRVHKYNELEDRAKVLNVKCKFERIFKARQKEFKESQKQDIVVSDDRPSQIAMFTGKQFDHPLKTGNWVAGDNGIFTYGDRGLIWACSHPIFPDVVLVNAETGVNKVRVWFKIRGIWKSTYIDRKAIASNNSIIQLADFGVAVTSNNAKALVQYLSEVEALNPDIICEKTSTGRLGWVCNTFMPYGEDIVFDNETSLKALFDSIPKKEGVGSEEKWISLIRELRSEKRIEILIYLASSLASVLVEPVGALPFIVDLWGETGKGKTVALMVAASIWADPSEGAYLSDAKATTTALEIRLNTLNSLPMMIDDMAQVENQYDGNFSTLVYNWCSGKGKERSNTSLGLNKTTTWKNCILTNAEHSMVTDTMKGGAVNRIIDVEMGEGYMFKDGNRVANTVKHNYGFCGMEFVKIIKEIGFEEVRKIQKKYYDEIRSYGKSLSDEKEEKQVMPMSIIMAADEISEQYIYKDGVRLNISDCFNLLKSQGEVSEHKRAYQYLIDQIIVNRTKFDVEDRENYRGEDWGYFLDDNICVIVGTVFADLLRKGGFQDKAFCSWAIRNKLITPDKDGRSRKNARIFGKQTKCVFLKMLENDGFIEPESTPFDDL